MSEFVTMAGVDHSTASLEIRERFAFTKAAAQAAMREAVEQSGVTGCVVLSTCNRTELWLSIRGSQGQTALNPAALLCAVRGVDPAEGSACISCRMGQNAERHLLETACGLHSRVFGEDQIVAQVNAALTASRDCGCAGPVLERLFRAAVTAAKRVKTTVRLAARDASAPARAVAVLEREWGTKLAGTECLVIGNGEMGCMAARELLARGCRVRMTLRSYRHGTAHIPAGCSAMPYEERYAALDTARIVVSATASPHHTLHYDAALAHLNGERCVLIDLAVPRDISVRLATVPGVTLYDIDTLSAEESSPQDRAGEERVAKARVILKEELERYGAWLSFRELRPGAEEIGAQAAEDLALRMEQALRRFVPEENRAVLEGALRENARKTAEKLVYGLRGLPEDLAAQSLARLVNAAEKRPAQYALHSTKNREEQA